ncbi:hypothetical protein RYX36_033050 [Vicia faba]
MSDKDLLPHHLKALYLLQHREVIGISDGRGKEIKGGIFNPLTIGGRVSLISLIMRNCEYNHTLRDQKMNMPKKTGPQPKNTLVFTSNVHLWRQELERHALPHLKVLYREHGQSGPYINFHMQDVVISSYENLKLPVNKKDRLLSSIERHDWERLVVENVVSPAKDTMMFLLHLNANNKWILGQEGIPPQVMSGIQINFLYALMLDNYRPNKEVLMGATLKKDDLYHFGSKVIQTVSVELTPQEENIYMEAENYVKEKLVGTKLHNIEFVKNLECWIVRLREMASHLSLRVKRPNIEENPLALGQLNKVNPDDICIICQSTLKILKIVTTCDPVPHVFCETCWFDWFLERETCGLCTRLMDDNTLFTSPFNCESSKVNELVNHLHRPESLQKSVVVSRFELLLSWLEEFLRERGLTVLRINEQMNVVERLQMVNKFENTRETNAMILLVNVEHICKKMDLYSIDQVYFMEGMKESLENEVISHFKGIDYKAFRFIVRGSIESRIVGLHGAVEGDLQEFNRDEIYNILT